MRLAVLVSGTGTILDAMAADGLSIALVIADRPCPAFDRAIAHGIPAAVLRRESFGDNFDRVGYTEKITGELEKQKIDLALLFTWREVARMKNSVATNLLLLDEVFDSSLDAEATESLLKILRSLGKGTNVFVISHKGEILVDKFMNTLKFEKQNDFSKLVDVS